MTVASFGARLSFPLMAWILKSDIIPHSTSTVSTTTLATSGFRGLPLSSQAMALETQSRIGILRKKKKYKK